MQKLGPTYKIFKCLEQFVFKGIMTLRTARIYFSVNAEYWSTICGSATRKYRFACLTGCRRLGSMRHTMTQTAILYCSTPPSQLSSCTPNAPSTRKATCWNLHKDSVSRAGSVIELTNARWARLLYPEQDCWRCCKEFVVLPLFWDSNATDFLLIVLLCACSCISARTC